MAFTSLCMACSLYNFQTSQCVETLFTIAGYQTPSRRNNPTAFIPLLPNDPALTQTNIHAPLLHPPSTLPTSVSSLAPADRLCQEKGREKRIKTGAHRMQGGEKKKEKKEKRRGEGIEKNVLRVRADDRKGH
ncbi:hypothetical protein CDAR_252281 [Caerostris darwini]|uniref:Uncharacterized protein n=1 Tax=Caerostris darwini TaxID=1538125 RepID=A0AAV4QD75_9ARAC|nr:hypothetical protein CDAR_252281 [Caerostris darwini]